MIISVWEDKDKMNEIIDAQPILARYIRENRGIDSLLGHIDILNITPIGQGGNGVVYIGKFGDAEVAIKFLLNCSTKKLDRFKAEYINTNMVRDKLVNVVNYLQYDCIQIENVVFPYIIMRKYEMSLKQYRKKLEKVTWEDVKKLFCDLAKAIKSMEACKIIHRDLKPENILIDDDKNYIITDFGIAHYESEDVVIKGLTKEGERLGNYNFSAPEQLNDGEILPATDLYAFVQIIYWFVFEETNKGIGGKKLYDIFKNNESRYIDNVIYHCLNNDVTKRLPSIAHIYKFISQMKEDEQEINPFDDMELLGDIACSVVPEFYSDAFFTSDKQDIERLIERICNAKPNRPFVFNTGRLNNNISSFRHFKGDYYILNYQLLRIVGVWGSITSEKFDDILLFQVETPEYFEINGEKYSSIAIINNNEMVPAETTYSGYVRYKGKVYNTRDLKIEEIYIDTVTKQKYYAVGTFAQCSTIIKNDCYLSEIQEFDELDRDKIYKLKQKIHENKHNDVYTYL